MSEIERRYRRLLGWYPAGLYLVPGLVASLVAVSVLRARRHRMPGGAPPA
jgi:hypothetical protein